MSEFLANLSAEGGILRTRSLISLGVTGGFVWGFVDGVITPELYVPVLSIVVTFYFAVRAVQAGVATVMNGSSNGAATPNPDDIA